MALRCHTATFDRKAFCTSNTTVCCCVCCIVEGGMFGPCFLSTFSSFTYQGTCRGSLHLKWSAKITYGFDDVLNAVTLSLLRRVWKIAKSDYSFMSAWSNSAPTGRIFMKFGIWEFFEKLFRRFVSIEMWQE